MIQYFSWNALINIEFLLSVLPFAALHALLPPEAILSPSRLSSLLALFPTLQHSRSVMCLFEPRYKTVR
eukprot:764948-Hanusia_phi.AAC.4